MPVPIQKFREIVLQVLYSLDIGQADHDELVVLLMHELRVTKKTVQEAIARAQAVRDHLEAIDEKIRGASVSYAFERIQVVERNILRLALFELVYDETIPTKVSIAEAIRLARKFGTPESASFVNAILDQLKEPL